MFSEELEQARLKVAQLSAVKDMVSGPGWAIVYNHFQEVLKSIFDSIIFTDKKPEEIMQLKERYRAFKSMLEVVEMLCNEHSSAIQTLENMEANKQEEDQYGQ